MVKPLWKTRNYFVHNYGYVFKIENGKEVECKIIKGKRGKEILVFIDNKTYSLLNIILEHFFPDLKPTDRVRFKSNKKLWIPVNSVKIKNLESKDGYSEADLKLLYEYKCDIKAYSANKRCVNKINQYEVFEVLKISNFKCTYCMAKLTPNTWHLDHFNPLGKDGKNVFENLVASCFICNTMKGALEGYNFYKMCLTITKNFQLKDSKIVNPYR